MAYMNRRSSGKFTGTPQAQVPTVGNIGQRRPVASNFVAGGQLNAQNKTAAQTPNQQRTPAAQNTNTGVNFRNQNQGYQTQAAAAQQKQPVPQQQQQKPVAQQQKQPVAQQQQQKQPVVQQQQQPKQLVVQQQKQPAPQQQQPPQQPAVQQQVAPQLQQQPVVKIEASAVPPGANPPNPALEIAQDEGMEVDTEPQKRKPFWAKGGKISKKEKMRRRNLRLSKMLQPKNAVMILNELVKNASYVVEELPMKTDTAQYKASVVVDAVEHVGYGRSKIHAKNSAAEVALKHLIQCNKLSEMKDEEGNEKMEVTEDSSQPPLPWQHVASFALFKLFTSWGDDPNKGSKIQIPGITVNESQRPHENRPAKKMPVNPETVNPLMLINQMLPHAQFEELGKNGVPPNISYTYRCTVNDEIFIGTGTNKKLAKKLAAFAACHKILNIEYPPEVYVPSSEPVDY